MQTTQLETVFLGPRNSVAAELTVSDAPSAIVLLTNVPLFVTLPEFVGELDNFADTMVLVRIILCPIPDAYGAVIALTSIDAAVALRKTLNLRPISALAKESLFVSFVHGSSLHGGLNALLSPPTENFGPPLGLSAVAASGKSLSPTPAPAGMTRAGSSPRMGSAAHSGDGADCFGGTAAAEGSQRTKRSSPLLQPNDVAAQCTICLEPLSESAQLVTVCSHAFHLSCFKHIQDEVCPLCRYSLTDDPATKSTCAVCGATEDLWMCLICGSVSCGRAVEGHGERHFGTSGHNYALQVGGFRVWDYGADAFVHRLISVDDEPQTLVDTSAKTAWWFDEEDGAELERAIFASKTEAVASFYSQLLQDQLCQQDAFYSRLIGAAARASHADVESAERDARHRIASNCIAEYRRIVATARVTVLGAQQPLRHRTRILTKEIAEMRTTLMSLSDGKSKVDGILADARLKHSSKVDALRRRQRELQAAFESLLAGAA